MKGFVPVTKQALLEMVEACHKETDIQLETETTNWLDYYITKEKERISTRRWYRLFILPKARFAFDKESVITYSANRSYDLFDCCPFISISRDALNSKNWLTKLERMGESEYSGEPILLDVNTFMRLSEPEKYYWARNAFHYSVRN